MRKEKILSLVVLVGLIACSISISAEGSERVDSEYLSEEIISYTEEIGEIYGICPELIQAVIERESNGRPEVTDGTSVGLMQITPRWHYDRMERLGVTDLWDPYSNILVGTDFLAELFREYDDPALVLMIYNGSSDALSRAESGELTDYAIAVLDRSAELERLHRK